MNNNDNNTNTDYLGTGWSFPPTFDNKSKGVELVSANDDIWQSLLILLSTSLGERVLQPTYGCNLRDRIFETFSPKVASEMKEEIRNAILYHEPRISLDRLELVQTREDELKGCVKIDLDYTILATNSRFNFVYPFYIKEGVGSV